MTINGTKKNKMVATTKTQAVRTNLHKTTSKQKMKKKCHMKTMTSKEQKIRPKEEKTMNTIQTTMTKKKGPQISIKSVIKSVTFCV
jgi:hypothetical protein